MTDLGPYGVVFSGGGALGAWEVGCLRSLALKHDNRYPEVLAGASSGALNAAGLALGMTVDDLQTTWSKLRPQAVFRTAPRGRSFGGLLLSIFVRWLRGAGAFESIMTVAASLKSAFDATPLEKTLDELLKSRWDNLSSFKGRLALAVTNLTTSSMKYYYYPSTAVLPDSRWYAITSFEVLKGALLASAAIPIVFEPRNDEVDGGVLQNQPLQAADKLLPAGKPIYVLVPHPDQLPAALNLAVLPGRVLEAWMSQGFKYELSRLAIRNIAGRALGKPPRPVCLIRPGLDLESFGSGLLKFGVKVDELILRGEKDADAALASFSENDNQTWPLELRS